MRSRPWSAVHEPGTRPARASRPRPCDCRCGVAGTPHRARHRPTARGRHRRGHGRRGASPVGPGVARAAFRRDAAPRASGAGLGGRLVEARRRRTRMAPGHARVGGGRPHAADRRSTTVASAPDVVHVDSRASSSTAIRAQDRHSESSTVVTLRAGTLELGRQTIRWTTPMSGAASDRYCVCLPPARTT